MDFEDLFRDRRHGYGGGHGHDRHRDHDDHHDDGYRRGSRDHHAMKAELLRRLLANKPMLIGLAVVAILLLILAVWLAFGLIGIVSQTGVKGLLDKLDVPGLLKKLWEGAAKG